MIDLIRKWAAAILVAIMLGMWVYDEAVEGEHQAAFEKDQKKHFDELRVYIDKQGNAE